MLNCLRQNADVYRSRFWFDVEALERIIAFGITETKPSEQQPSDVPEASQQYWFNADCVQVAADSFKTPIAVYNDQGYTRINTDATFKRIRVLSPLLYLSFRKPEKTHKPVQLVLHHANGNHWMSDNIKDSWLDPLSSATMKECAGHWTSMMV